MSGGRLPKRARAEAGADADVGTDAALDASTRHTARLMSATAPVRAAGRERRCALARTPGAALLPSPRT
jgi:hypothetical protein